MLPGLEADSLKAKILIPLPVLPRGRDHVGLSELTDNGDKTYDAGDDLLDPRPRSLFGFRGAPWALPTPAKPPTPPRTPDRVRSDLGRTPPPRLARLRLV
ncbi:hypothetical protein VTH06DRAFT_4934 [Thermothelomyces fergusii]